VDGPGRRGHLPVERRLGGRLGGVGVEREADPERRHEADETGDDREHEEDEPDHSEDRNQLAHDDGRAPELADDSTEITAPKSAIGNHHDQQHQQQQQQQRPSGSAREFICLLVRRRQQSRLDKMLILRRLAAAVVALLLLLLFFGAGARRSCRLRARVRASGMYLNSGTDPPRPGPWATLIHYARFRAASLRSRAASS